MSIILDTQTFEKLYYTTVEELFFYNYFTYVCQDANFCTDSPIYYFRYNNKKSGVFMNIHGEIIENQYIFSHNQILEVNALSQNHDNQNFLKEYLISRNPEWNIFLSTGPETMHGVVDPESLTHLEINAHMFDQQESFFIKQAYFLIQYSKHTDYHLTQYFFDQLFAEDPENPFMLMRYARFLGSSCYKVKKNPIFLDKAEDCLFLAIKRLGSLHYIFTFCSAWIGQLYQARSMHNRAILFFEMSIKMNESRGWWREEPYIWKSNSLLALGLHQESLSILEHVMTHPNTKNAQKTDFRNYKTLARNYWMLAQFGLFQENFLNMCLYFQQSHSDVTIRFHNMHAPIANLETILPNILLRDFQDFCQYHTHDGKVLIDLFILKLGWYYLKRQTGVMDLHCPDHRGIDQLAFSYLQSLL